MTEELVQWNKVKGLDKAGIDQLLDLRREKKVVFDQAKAALDTVSNKILNALLKAGVKSVGVEETRLTVVGDGKPTEKFDKKKCYARLLELGVDEKKVKKAYKDATTEGEPREVYLLVTEPKEEGKGKGGGK